MLISTQCSYQCVYITTNRQCVCPDFLIFGNVVIKLAVRCSTKVFFRNQMPFIIYKVLMLSDDCTHCSYHLWIHQKGQIRVLPNYTLVMVAWLNLECVTGFCYGAYLLLLHCN
uniref:Uncharacterized protein n=1 Tax=Opuntia streptacantha TaxID=393608 RepID=A0A7C9D7D1_OPUST